MKDIFGLLDERHAGRLRGQPFFWSDIFHYRKTYQFARTLYKNALNADVTHGEEPDANRQEPSRVPKQQAFALGWIATARPTSRAIR